MYIQPKLSTKNGLKNIKMNLIINGTKAWPILQVGFELCLLSGPKSFEVHHMESWLYTIRKTTIKLFLFYKFFFIVGEIVDPHRPRLVV